jgi:hypothetical protein
VEDFPDVDNRRTRNERIGLDFSVQFQAMESAPVNHRHRRSDLANPVSGYQRIY